MDASKIRIPIKKIQTFPYFLKQHGCQQNSNSNSNRENLKFSFFPRITWVPAKFEFQLRKFKLFLIS